MHVPMSLTDALTYMTSSIINRWSLPISRLMTTHWWCFRVSETKCWNHSTDSMFCAFPQ